MFVVMNDYEDDPDKNLRFFVAGPIARISFLSVVVDGRTFPMTFESGLSGGNFYRVSSEVAPASTTSEIKFMVNLDGGALSYIQPCFGGIWPPAASEFCAGFLT